jgi:hypothetical protein
MHRSYEASARQPQRGNGFTRRVSENKAQRTKNIIKNIIKNRTTRFYSRVWSVE